MTVNNTNDGSRVIASAQWSTDAGGGGGGGNDSGNGGSGGSSNGGSSTGADSLVNLSSFEIGFEQDFIPI